MEMVTMTLTELLTDLEAKAKQATPGLWDYDPSGPEDNDIWAVETTNPDKFVAEASCDLNARYIAACSPDRILALVAYVRKLEQMKLAADDLVWRVGGVGNEYLRPFKKPLEDALAVLAAHLDAEDK